MSILVDGVVPCVCFTEVGMQARFKATSASAPKGDGMESEVGIWKEKLAFAPGHLIFHGGEGRFIRARLTCTPTKSILAEVGEKIKT
jgi:hypothetical protein